MARDHDCSTTITPVQPEIHDTLQPNGYRALSASSQDGEIESRSAGLDSRPSSTLVLVPLGFTTAKQHGGIATMVNLVRPAGLEVPGLQSSVETAKADRVTFNRPNESPPVQQTGALGINFSLLSASDPETGNMHAWHCVQKAFSHTPGGPKWPGLSWSGFFVMASVPYLGFASSPATLTLSPSNKRPPTGAGAVSRRQRTEMAGGKI